MPTIKFVKDKEPLEVEAGENLMKALSKRGTPVASSCKGQLICGKCALKVEDGAYNLSSPSQDERDFMDLKDIPSGHRMACTCTVEGDICLDAPYW